MSGHTEAGAGDTMTTYRRADGELIMDDYGWVGSLDWIDDEDTFDVVEEVWGLRHRRIGTHYHRTELCATCAGEGVLTEADGEDCPDCNDGQHSNAGELVWKDDPDPAGTTPHERWADHLPPKGCVVDEFGHVWRITYMQEWSGGRRQFTVRPDACTCGPPDDAWDCDFHDDGSGSSGADR